MSREYERIIDWFLTMLGDEKVRQPVLEWLGAAHDQAATSSCGCTYCMASHRVLHLFKDMKRSELIDGSPWVRVGAMGQIRSFLETLPKTPQTLEAAAACEAEFARIIQDNNLPAPEPVLRPGIIQMLMGSPDSMVEIMTLLLGSGRDKGNPIESLLKSLPAAAGEKTSDDSGDQTEAEDSEDDTDASDDTHDHMETTMNAATESSTSKPITTHITGTAFTKDGVRIEPPEGVTYDDMIAALQRQAKEEDQVVSINERIEAFMMEGALAFQAALKQEFGWVQKGDSAPEMPAFLAMLFGAPPAEPVRMLTVQTSLTTSTQVVWDKVRMPGIDGHLQPGFEFEDGRFFFRITGEVKKKHQARAMQVIATARRIAATESIYRGQALELDLPPVDRNTDILKHAPRFMKGLDAIDPQGMIFTKKLEEELETYVFGIIRRTKLLAKLGVSAHRGALFMGPPGTGKTLAAANTAKICVENGWTFFYVKDPKEIVPMYKLAATYGPAVLFVEDVDQAVLSGEDDEEVSDEAKKRFRALLNVLDGVDTKGDQVFVIFTTNKDPRTFDPAFTREARLDSIINFTAPDQEAVERLIHWYLGDQLEPGADLSEVSAQLAGLRPATIKEVCAKSILGAAARLPANLDLDSLPDGIINADDLAVAARVAREQLELAKPIETEAIPNSDEEKAAVFLGKHIERAIDKGIATIAAAVTSANHGAAPKPANGHTNGHSETKHNEPAPEA